MVTSIDVAERLEFSRKESILRADQIPPFTAQVKEE